MSAGPRFDQPVAHDGYAWWYVDALSDDGRHGLTIIAFIGSVFSPYYAWARRRGRGHPAHHCAVNVALYGPRARWAMTERGRGALRRDVGTLAIGPSALTWDGTSLRIDVAEVTAPLPSRLRGTVRVHPAAVVADVFALDAAGRHRWQPLAPVSRVEVAFERPDVTWSGAGYLDTNAGDAPMEDDFARWDWSCARVGDGAEIHYDRTPRAGARDCLAIRVDRAGAVRHVEPPAIAALPRTLWRVARETREAGARVDRTLEDAPFYARSVLAARRGGADVAVMHETLDLDRFRNPLVQAMLPFRIPRRGG